MMNLQRLFPIIEVPPDAAEETEAMGTKQKFWYEDRELGWCLFKYSRAHAGEDWAEKVAEQICVLLGIPHARYELGVYREVRGVTTPRFSRESERLIPGNELLVSVDPDYPVHASSARLKAPQHTVNAIATVLDEEVAVPRSFEAVPPITTAWDVFIGYLMLDVLIGNTDRHHENWALVESIEADHSVLRWLAPTHDHGSSMGRNEPEARLQTRLVTRDRNQSAEAYAERCVSKIYRDAAEKKPLSSIDAFRAAAESGPGAADAWLNRLGGVSPEEIRAIFAGIPPGRISTAAAEFATRILNHNRLRLLEARGSFQ
jgi:hypothetical protein